MWPEGQLWSIFLVLVLPYKYWTITLKQVTTSFHISYSVIQHYITYAADERSLTKQSDNKKWRTYKFPAKDGPEYQEISHPEAMHYL
jgi:hypothetical protein